MPNTAMVQDQELSKAELIRRANQLLRDADFFAHSNRAQRVFENRIIFTPPNGKCQRRRKR